MPVSLSSIIVTSETILSQSAVFNHGFLLTNKPQRQNSLFFCQHYTHFDTNFNSKIFMTLRIR